MSYLNVSYLWLLCFLILPFIFKIRSQNAKINMVPHLDFWLTDKEKEQHNRWNINFQNLSFLLFLLFIIINFSVADPYFGDIKKKQPRCVILIDTFKTMKTIEKDKNRFQLVQEIIERDINYSENIILTTNKILQLTTMKNISTLATSEISIKKSISFAINLCKEEDFLVIFTDAVHPDWKKQTKSLLKRKNTFFYVIGEYHKNAGISVATKNSQLNVKIYNDYNKVKFVDLKWGKIKKENERPLVVEKKTIKLFPTKTKSISFDHLESGWWAFELDAKDNFAKDNQISYFIPPKKKSKILVIANKKLPGLIAALGAYQNIIDVKNSSFATKIPKDKYYDLLIVHKKIWNMPKKVQFKKVLFWNSKGNFLPHSYRVSKDVTVINKAHALMSNVDFSLLDVKLAHIYPHAKIPLLSSLGGATMWLGKYNNIPYVYAGFNLENTNITYLPSFPIFMKNIIQWSLPIKKIKHKKQMRTPVFLKTPTINQKPFIPKKQQSTTFLKWYILAFAYILGLICIIYF